MTQGRTFLAPRAPVRVPGGRLSGVRASWGLRPGLGLAGGCRGHEARERGGRGRLGDGGDYTQSERLGLKGTMLWFQGAIPAAIASAKRSGAVFVVFVAGDWGEGPRTMALLVCSGFSLASSELGRRS